MLRHAQSVKEQGFHRSPSKIGSFESYSVSAVGQVGCQITRPATRKSLRHMSRSTPRSIRRPRPSGRFRVSSFCREVGSHLETQLTDERTPAWKLIFQMPTQLNGFVAR